MSNASEPGLLSDPGDAVRMVEGLAAGKVSEAEAAGGFERKFTGVDGFGGGGGSRTRVRRCYWSRDYMLIRVPRAPSGPKAFWGNHSPLALRTDKTRERLAR